MGRQVKTEGSLEKAVGEVGGGGTRGRQLKAK